MLSNRTLALMTKKDLIKTVKELQAALKDLDKLCRMQAGKVEHQTICGMARINFPCSGAESCRLARGILEGRSTPSGTKRVKPP